MAKTKKIVSATPTALLGRRNAARPRVPVNLKMPGMLRELIDAAAALESRSRSDFMLDAARRAAEDALLSRSAFVASSAAFATFIERLDAPPKPNAALKRTLRTPAPWDKA